MSAVDNAIQDVFRLVARMFDLVDEQLADAVNVLMSGSEDLALQVRKLDKEVDTLELAIDAECERILGAGSLQGSIVCKAIAAMRMTADLERMGDQCKNVATGAIRLQDFASWRSDTCIVEMADAVRSMVRATREALSNGDRLAARKVMALDLRVDRAYRDLIADIIRLCEANPDKARSMVHLAFIGKFLERIADNAKSVAKSIVYSVEGIDIRHLAWQQS